VQLIYNKKYKLEIQQILIDIESELIKGGYTFERKDFQRPWGAFWVIDEVHAKKFIESYFPTVDPNQLMNGQKLSPKILFVKPKSRLSWQYHYRRREIWRVLQGPVGVIRSNNDEEQDLEIFAKGEQLELSQGERHRLIGLENHGVVAEIWVHIEPGQPSDEEDIVRLQDDFKRT
jgi:mannose-6-phosphate isomerase-like protein (cupin superfamily)